MCTAARVERFHTCAGAIQARDAWLKSGLSRFYEGMILRGPEKRAFTVYSTESKRERNRRFTKSREAKLKFLWVKC